jgi:hypothetical protein
MKVRTVQFGAEKVCPRQICPFEIEIAEIEVFEGFPGQVGGLVGRRGRQYCADLLDAEIGGPTR